MANTREPIANVGDAIVRPGSVFGNGGEHKVPYTAVWELATQIEFIQGLFDIKQHLANLLNFVEIWIRYLRLARTRTRR